MDRREERWKRLVRGILYIRGRLVSLVVCNLRGHRWVAYQTSGWREPPECVGRCERCRFDTGDHYGPDEGGWF